MFTSETLHTTMGNCFGSIQDNQTRQRVDELHTKHMSSGMAAQPALRRAVADVANSFGRSSYSTSSNQYRNNRR